MKRTPEAGNDHLHTHDHTAITAEQVGNKTSGCAPMVCPRCKKGVLDYNGWLEMTCPVCGYRESGGAFT